MEKMGVVIEEGIDPANVVTVIENVNWQGKINAYFFYVLKKGRKYLYGKYLNDERKGDRIHVYMVPADHKVMIDREGVRVFEGMKWDLLEKVSEYEEARRKYYDAMARVEREARDVADRVARRIYHKLVERWERQNSPPRPEDYLGFRI